MFLLSFLPPPPLFLILVFFIFSHHSRVPCFPILLSFFPLFRTSFPLLILFHFHLHSFYLFLSFLSFSPFFYFYFIPIYLLILFLLMFVFSLSFLHVLTFACYFPHFPLVRSILSFTASLFLSFPSHYPFPLSFSLIFAFSYIESFSILCFSHPPSLPQSHPFSTNSPQPAYLS